MDQRFATDWFLLGHAGAAPGAVSYLGPDWTGTAGTEVLAVADGRVVSTGDGIPDEPVGGWGASGTVMNWETIGGNAITLDLGEARFAWYGHLQAGSLRVQPGDTVRRGQVLGLIGNSGATTAPHLHFQITDSATLGKGRGLAFVFECFDLMARTDSRVQWTGEGELYLQPADDQRRKLETPLGGAVVFFPEAPGSDAESGCDGWHRNSRLTRARQVPGRLLDS
ncbi:MAG TPA: M23 family metallopeptidase [Longimicrobiales bacterium]|nr:M23 family metallopeptidase [Longimicrobiales bacterium]